MGGAEHALLAILSRLSPEIVEPLLICPARGPLTEYADRLGIASFILPLANFRSTSTVVGGKKVLNPFNSFYDLIAVLAGARRLAKVLVANRIALVHTNTMFAHFYGSMAARRVGIPSIWNVHDLIETRRFGGIAGEIFRIAARLPNYLIAVSEAVRQAMPRLPGETVYIGVDLEEIERGRRQPLNLPFKLTGVPTVAYVGRIAYAKGTDILVRAAPQVVQAIPDIRFVVAGEAPTSEKQYGDELCKLIREMGLERNFILTGYQQNVFALMDQADCIVLPSRRESFGRVLVEAGALGKPAIATRMGGIPEIIVHGETGILAEPENPSALAAGIVELITHQTTALNMGQNARRRIHSTFTLDQTTQKIVNIYDHVVPGIRL